MSTGTSVKSPSPHPSHASDDDTYDGKDDNSSKKGDGNVIDKDVKMNITQTQRQRKKAINYGDFLEDRDYGRRDAVDIRGTFKVDASHVADTNTGSSMVRSPRNRRHFILIDYASSGQIDMIEEFFAKREGRHAIDDTVDGNTALMHAAVYGHVEVVNLLIEEGANIHHVNPISGKTPLMYASRKGHLEIVELLLSKGVALDVQDKKGMTALMW